jgi:hypothetical protein
MDHLDEKVNGGPSMEITDEVVSVRDRKRSFLYINSPLHIHIITYRRSFCIKAHARPRA